MFTNDTCDEVVLSMCLCCCDALLMCAVHRRTHTHAHTLCVFNVLMFCFALLHDPIRSVRCIKLGNNFGFMNSGVFVFERESLIARCQTSLSLFQQS